MAVVGPSGIGKSSLIRAGVVATLLREGHRVLVTTPGAHPMATVHELVTRGRQVLVVDQAEELITVCTDPQERAAYVAAVAGHAASGGSLVLSLRADHLGDLAPHPAIAGIIEDGLLLLGPMSEAALRQAIEGPARRAGLRLEPGLVDLLVRDVEGEPASLPLLSHVLRETWQRREGPTLTVDGYRATGGVRHAVAQTAETLYESLDGSARARLRGLLLRLVQPSEDGEPVRTRLPRDKAATDAEHTRLLEQLVAARLVTIDGESVQIAHEALFREWPRLRGWLDDDVEGQRLFRHLTAAADAWAALDQPDSELYRGVRLSRTVDWRDRVHPDLDEGERAFLDASVALNQTEVRAAAARLAYQRVVNRRLRGALGAVVALLVLAMIAGTAALGTADRARRNQASAEAAARVADARRAGAQALVSEDPATSLLLAVAALRAEDSAQARDTLGAALMRNRSLLAVRQLNGVDSVAASGDGAFIAASQTDMGVALFDANTLQPRPFADHTPTSLVRFSPDGSLLATSLSPWPPNTPWVPHFYAQPVRLYDMPSGKPAGQQLRGWPTQAAVEYGLEFSNDGRRVAAAIERPDPATREWSPTGTLAVWDLSRRAAPLFSVQVPKLVRAVLSPDGRRVYALTNGSRSVREYDVDSGKLVRSARASLLLGSKAGGAAVSPDGSTLAVSAGSQILWFDTGTLRVVGPPTESQQDAISGIRFSPDGTSLVASGSDGTAFVWDTTSRVEVSRFLGGRVKNESWEAAFSSDGRSVFAGTGDLMKWDLSGSHEQFSALSSSSGVDERLDLALAAPDGRMVARQASGRLWFVDARSGESTTPVAASSVEPDVRSWSDDGQWFMANGEDHVLRVWNVQTGRQVAERPSASSWGWAAAAFGPSADQIYAVEGERADLLTLDRATLAELGSARPVEHAGFALPLQSVVPAGDSRTLLVVRADGLLWRVDPRDVNASFPMDLVLDDSPSYADRSFTPAVSPDRTRLVGLDDHHQVRLVNLETSTWLPSATKADWESDFTFAYAPDSGQIASAAPDRIRFWNGHTGEYQGSLPLPERSLGVSIAYLPDSSGLLVTTREGRIWTVRTSVTAWVDRACAIAGRSLTQDEWNQFFPDEAYREPCTS